MRACMHGDKLPTWSLVQISFFTYGVFQSACALCQKFLMMLFEVVVTSSVANFFTILLTVLAKTYSHLVDVSPPLLLLIYSLVNVFLAEFKTHHILEKKKKGWVQVLELKGIALFGVELSDSSPWVQKISPVGKQGQSFQPNFYFYFYFISLYLDDKIIICKLRHD